MNTIKLIAVALLLVLPIASQAQYFEISTNSCPNPSLTISGVTGDIVVSVTPSNATGSNSVMQYSTCKIWSGGTGTMLQAGKTTTVPLKPNLTYGILVMCMSDCSDDLEPTTTTNSPPAINPSFTVTGKPSKGQPASKVMITLMDQCVKVGTPGKPAQGNTGLQSIKQINKNEFGNMFRPVLTPFKKLP